MQRNCTQCQVQLKPPKYAMVFCQPTFNVVVISCGQLNAQTVRPEFAQGLPGGKRLLKLC